MAYVGKEARARRQRRPTAPAIGLFPSTARITSRRQCRICRCSCDDDPCFEARDVPHPLFPKFVVKKKTRQCHWVAPDLCSFCAADGGPGHEAKFTPDDYSGLLDRFGQPLLKWHLLPR